jgi:hypothetical protein
MLGKLDDQLSRLHLNAHNVSFDEVTIVNRLCRFQMLPNLLDHERLDVSRGHSAHRSRTVRCWAIE